EAVKSLGGGKSPVSKSLLASHLNEDQKAQSLALKIASAKSFGIIEGRSDFLLTDLAKRYFFPTAPLERSQSLIAFLGNPPSFRAIINRFDGSKLPDAEMLGNIIHKEANVPVS